MNLNTLTEAPQASIKGLVIKLSDKLTEPEPVFLIGGLIVASPGNFSLVKAPSKHGKTWLLSMLAAAWLRGDCLGIEARPHKTNVLYIDSEQSKAQVFKVLKRVHTLAGLPTDQSDQRITMIYAKEQSYSERLADLQAIINDSFGLVIIDGIVDFLGNFNNELESAVIRDILLQMCGQLDLHIITAIHTNKSDNNGRGHLGAFIEQKSETVFQLKKDTNIFEVTPAYCRHQDFEPFKFTIEDDLPQLHSSDPKEDKAQKQRNTFRKILSTPLTYNGLVTTYAQATGLSEATGKRHISQMIYDNLLIKNTLNEYLYNE